MNPNDGGPAFPTIRDVTHEQNWETEYGMSLRDAFAKEAMAALIGSSQYGYGGDLTVESNFRYTAEVAYKMADAMLAARSAEK